jgi:glycosyltransferase involved in cell wall biosynthesis
MRALQLTTHIDIGGIGNYVLSLSRALKAEGVECVVASSGGSFEGEFAEGGIPLKRINIKTKSELSPKVFMAVLAVKRLVKEENIDIIHAHTRVSQVVAFFVSRLTGVPYVTTCHGFFKKRLRGVFDTWGDKVIAISDAVRQHLLVDLGVKENRVKTVYSGVDIEKFSKKYSAEELSDIKSSLGLAGGRVVGTIGRLSDVKGQSYLIQAVFQILSKRKDVVCVIAGDGPEEKSLKGLAKNLGIDRSVRFMRSQPDTRQLLSDMDLFVFPSVKEGLGLSLLEAMAAGRPCAASDIGGISDIIEDRRNGLLFPVGDVRKMKESITALLDDADFRRVIGEAARETVAKRFPLKRMAAGIAAVYREVLEHDGRP